MPASAVYQPTTVTYEQQPTDQRWNCPTSYFARRVTNGLICSERAIYVRISISVLGCILSIVGLALTITSAVKYNDTPQPTPDSTENGRVLLIAGAVILCLGICIDTICIWIWTSRWVGGKDAPVNGGTGLTGLNPSTDPLVAAQYAPVRDAPPAPDDETRNLMDNKECLSSAEESDKMLDGRPAVA